MHRERHTQHFLLFRAWKRRMHQKAQDLAFSMAPSRIRIGPIPYTESELSLGLPLRKHKRILNVIIGTFSESMTGVCPVGKGSQANLDQLNYWNEDSN